MHLKRWLTAIIAIPILVLLIGFGPRWMFYSVLCAVSLAGLMEFYGITAARLPRFACWGTYLLTFLLFAALYMRQILLMPVIILLWALIPMAWFMLAHSSHKRGPAEEIGKAVLGPVYVTLPLALLVLIDIRPGGQGWVFFLLAVILQMTPALFILENFLENTSFMRLSAQKKPGKAPLGDSLPV